MSCVTQSSCRRALLLAALLVAAAPVCAQTDAVAPEQQLPGVYKWADRNGVLHYDDESLTEPRLTLDILDARRIPPARDQGAPASFVSNVAQRCAMTRDRLLNYQGARALYGRDPFGNVYLMSSTQVALAIGALSRDQTRYCGPDAAKKLYLLARARTTNVDAASAK